MDSFLHITCGEESGAWSHQVPKTPDFFPPILDSLPCPQHLLDAGTGRGGPDSRAGLHVPGWGGTSALTSSSQPGGWTELDGVKGALSPSPGRTALGSAFVGGLWPLPAQPPTEMLSRPWGPRPSLGESSWSPHGPVSQVSCGPHCRTL